MDQNQFHGENYIRPDTGNRLHGSLKVCGDEFTQHKNYKLVECNISLTITITPKFINLVQLVVFMHIISHQFTNCGNMYTSFIVVVVTAAVALVITLGRHVWHYARSICLIWCSLISVHFLPISHGCVKC
jgi:hypothetical protein